jgi:hypothetical protein
MNFYRADPALRICCSYICDALFHLSSPLDQLRHSPQPSRQIRTACRRHPPVLHQRDRFRRGCSGSNIIRPIANWKAAFGEFGIHAMSIRKGRASVVSVLTKHAFTFLFNQAEFGWAADQRHCLKHEAAQQFQHRALKRDISTA